MTETIFSHNGYMYLPARAAVGVLLATGVAGIAWRLRLLSRSGFAGAVTCGTLGFIAGWSWAALLVLYFLAASVASRAGEPAKGLRAEGVVSKTGPRDAIQVFANGGVYSVAAMAAVLAPHPWLVAGAIGGLAAASGDSWATEIGLWLGGKPRLITTGTIVREGESGGITTAGLGGSLIGAAVVSGMAVALGFSRGVGIASLVGGVGGSIVDSVLGATVQEKRWCDGCNGFTETPVHLCGHATRLIGGIQSVDNDVVNLLSTFAGFLLGMMVYWMIEQ